MYYSTKREIPQRIIYTGCNSCENKSHHTRWWRGDPELILFKVIPLQSSCLNSHNVCLGIEWQEKRAVDLIGDNPTCGSVGTYHQPSLQNIIYSPDWWLIKQQFVTANKIVPDSHATDTIPLLIIFFFLCLQNIHGTLLLHLLIRVSFASYPSRKAPSALILLTLCHYYYY